MTDHQKKLIPMMAYFHDFCVKNNLKYYAIGGTLLGAVRHKGFIPWDDDIDIGMPRQDYERLHSLFHIFDNNLYKLEWYAEDKNFIYPFSKVYDKNTTLIENVNPPFKRGIYLDVFPLDGVGILTLDIKIKILAIRIIQKIILLKILNYNKNRVLYKRILISILKCFTKYISFYMCNHILNKLSSLTHFEDSKFGGNLFGAWGNKEIMSTNFFGTPRLYQFENIKIYGVEQYDNYLSTQYGNYMQLPPIEKQKSHHSYLICDLNTPYINKLRE